MDQDTLDLFRDVCDALSAQTDVNTTAREWLQILQNTNVDVWNAISEVRDGMLEISERLTAVEARLANGPLRAA